MPPKEDSMSCQCLVSLKDRIAEGSIVTGSLETAKIVSLFEMYEENQVFHFSLESGFLKLCGLCFFFQPENKRRACNVTSFLSLIF